MFHGYEFVLLTVIAMSDFLVFGTRISKIY